MYCETVQRTSLRNRSSVGSDVSTYDLFYKAYMLNFIVHIYNGKNRTAAMGKNAGEGDTLESPTARMEYGFAEFDSEGALTKPAWIKTFSRETHGDSNSRWLEQVEYSDGLGQVALVKTKAEPDKNSNERWAGTGRTVLNNKGNPVKQYEPYFSFNENWENEDEVRNIGVTPVMHYDPLSRLVRTDFPDGTYSKVEFTSWIQKDYDRCDTAENSPHYNTPTITHLDSLGRAFYAIANDGVNNNIVTRTVLDIEGNEKEIIDARGNIVMEYKYGIHGEKAYTKSMDSGERWMLLAADEQPILTWDSRGHRIHAEFDVLRRPTKQWLSVNDGTEKLVGETVYGEQAPNNEQNNLRGQIWKTRDQSGEIQNVAYDFKGNLLETKRRLTKEYKNTIDWSQNVTLEEETFTTITAYDALNRATNIKAPHNSNDNINEILPEYDEGGLLKSVKAKLRGSAEITTFVEGIDYNPKVQRERIKYGNGATTKYTYDKNNFRLTRLWTFRNGGTENLQDLNYAYDEMGNITKITDNAQKAVFYDNQQVNPSQTFKYDALYRLVEATGREHTDNGAETELEEIYPNIRTSMPDDASALRNYTREWEYDKVGNILNLVHTANSGNWNRQYSYASDNNRLLSTKVGNDTVNYTHNEHGSMASMPHLQAMEWDFAERLSHITRGTTEAYYNYDGNGERVRKVVEKGGVVETRLYLGGFEIFRKRVNGSVDTERETLHIMDDKKRVAVVETLTIDGGTAVSTASVQRYQLNNNIESASLELDENSGIISYEEYYPYGDTSYQAGRVVSEVSQKRYRYAGKEKDGESGLYYYGARYYSSMTGIFISVDPEFEEYLEVSPYVYCLNNPIKYVDADGRLPVLAVIGIKGIVGAAVDVGAQVTVLKFTEGDLGKAFSKIDLTSVGASFVASAISIPGLSAGAKAVTTGAKAAKAATSSANVAKTVTTGAKAAKAAVANANAAAIGKITEIGTKLGDKVAKLSNTKRMIATGVAIGIDAAFDYSKEESHKNIFTSGSSTTKNKSVGEAFVDVGASVIPGVTGDKIFKCVNKAIAADLSSAIVPKASKNLLKPIKETLENDGFQIITDELSNLFGGIAGGAVNDEIAKNKNHNEEAPVNIQKLDYRFYPVQPIQPIRID